jgi:hypothetical protein
MKLPFRLYHPLNMAFSDHGGPSRDDTDLLDCITVCHEDSASQQPLTFEVSECLLEIADETPQGSSMVNSLTVATSTPSGDSYKRLASGKIKKRGSFVWDSETGQEVKDSAGKLHWRCNRCTYKVPMFDRRHGTTQLTIILRSKFSYCCFLFQLLYEESNFPSTRCSSHWKDLLGVLP